MAVNELPRIEETDADLREGPDSGGSDLARFPCPRNFFLAASSQLVPDLRPFCPLSGPFLESRSTVLDQFLFSLSLPQFNHFLETTQGWEALAASENHTEYCSLGNVTQTTLVHEWEEGGWVTLTRVNNPDAHIGNLHREGHPARSKRAVEFSSPSLTDTRRPQGIKSGCEENPGGARLQPIIS